LNYDLNIKGQEEILKAMQRTSEKAESEINKVLHSQGGKEVSQSIIGFMPISDRNKKHAKTSNSLRQKDINLGFQILARGGAAKNKNSFGYLVFPNEGRGRSNPVAQSFFETGLESKETYLTRLMLDALELAAQI